MSQESYKVIYRDYSNRTHKEKNIHAYNIYHALEQARKMQYLRHDICVMYVKSKYGRCVWL